MTREIMEHLKALGVDWTRTMERFLYDEEMYTKFLLKFAYDEHRQTLLESVSRDDKENVEIAAHTLKGVSSNLGLEQLQNIYSEIVNHMREKGNVSLKTLMEEEKQAYQNFKNVAEEIKDLV